MLKTLSIGGKKIGFAETEGRAPTLVCVHGAAGDHRVFDALLAHMPGQAAIAIDLPGRHQSEGPPVQSAAQAAPLIKEVVEALEVDECVLVGHSFGGGVVQEAALSARPQGLMGLVLACTGARLRVRPVILAAWANAAERGEHVPLPPAFFESTTSEQTIAGFQQRQADIPPQTADADWRACNRFDRLRDVEAIDVPTLVVAGQNDTLTPPKYAQYLHGALPRAELVVFEGAGHGLIVERASELATTITSWLDRNVRA